mmetsp:Transcript_9572/g.19831  ORF Transcript_9572/g.19831 Transcript_9572/m.19831 type:complete len:238 (+) Transcript_9572:509-1222(+)
MGGWYFSTNGTLSIVPSFFRLACAILGQFVSLCGHRVSYLCLHMLCIQVYGSRTRTTGKTLVMLVFRSCAGIFVYFSEASLCFPHGTCQRVPPALSFLLLGILQFLLTYMAIGFVPVLNIPAIPNEPSIGSACSRNSSQRSNPRMTGLPPYRCSTADHLGRTAMTSGSISSMPASCNMSTNRSRPFMASAYVIFPSAAIAALSYPISRRSSFLTEVRGLYTNSPFLLYCSSNWTRFS